MLDTLELLIQRKFQINFCIFRIINLREGHSQVQLVLLASDKCGRRSNKIYAF